MSETLGMVNALTFRGASTSRLRIVRDHELEQGNHALLE